MNMTATSGDGEKIGFSFNATDSTWNST